MNKGTVKWFNSRKGYGFITPDEGENDIFVHHTGITGSDDEFKTLNEGDKVEYEITQGDKGPNATDVVVTEAAPRRSRGHSNNNW